MKEIPRKTTLDTTNQKDALAAGDNLFTREKKFFKEPMTTSTSTASQPPE